MNWTCKILASVVASMLALPAWAASSTGYGQGGRTRDYAVIVQQHDQSGELFRITGHCQSACTMFLAIRNVCVEPGARLLFHAGQNAIATDRMFNSYNAALRSYLTASRAMETAKFHTISGRDMIGKFGYRRCP
jgi:hypothetical protein